LSGEILAGVQQLHQTNCRMREACATARHQIERARHLELPDADFGQQLLPGAPAFEFAGARSFVVFEGAGFRFTEAPELPTKKTKNVRKRIHRPAATCERRASRRAAAYHQWRRRSPATKSKCWSRLTRERECWRQSAAIQRSFAGMGLPFLFNSRPMAE
jgi:hypothetical protein